MSYYASTDQYLVSHAPRTPTVTTIHRTFIENAGQGSLYTDSDGISRLASFTITGTTSKIYQTALSYSDFDLTAMGSRWYEKGLPTCTIERNICRKIQNSWLSAHSGNESMPRLEYNGGIFEYGPGFPRFCPNPECQCVVRGDNVALIYLPPLNENNRVSSAWHTSSFTQPGVDSSLVFTTQAITLTSTQASIINGTLTQFLVHNTSRQFLHIPKKENG
jgi:hypothetical protein